MMHSLVGMVGILRFRCSSPRSCGGHPEVDHHTLVLVLEIVARVWRQKLCVMIFAMNYSGSVGGDKFALVRPGGAGHLISVIS
jgi:hypothetical protein